MEIENYSNSLKLLIDASYNYASENQDLYLTPMHVMSILIKNDEDVRKLLLYKKIDLEQIFKETINFVDKTEKKRKNIETQIQSNLLLIFEEAKKIAVEVGAREITTLIFFSSLNSNTSPITKKLMEKYGLYSEVLKKLIESPVNKETEKSYETINKYTIDITKAAKNDNIDPVIGRDTEIKRSIQIISRRTKNNPILIGEPGVGKTAIAEGIALKIIEKDIPEGLESFKLLSLDLSAVLSGAKYRGEFEERLKNLISEIDEHENIILFIDEIHTIIGTGANEGALDVANILKPALARGKLHCIGATTIQEYRKYFEKDAALSRRFQPIYINEPSIEDTILILKGIKEKYEIHHGISISEDAIISASKLSSRYITSRKLPDKAIDLIDEAASKKRMQIKSKPERVELLEKKILKNKIELQILSKDKNKNLNKINSLRDINDCDKKELSLCLKDWEAFKRSIEKLNYFKEDLENKTNELKKAERAGDFDKAGKLIHLIIPKIKSKIKELEVEESIAYEDKKVTRNDIAKVVSQWTGIPVNKLLTQEKKSLINLDKTLKENIIGQDIALETVASAIKRSRAGVNDPSKPIGSFLFLGPTGVGKTEVAKKLAFYLFNNEKELLTFDMSDYSEKHSVSKLIGSPPGYVGYENGGILTKAVKDKPFRVILFDEIEKAHQDIYNILLQVLDEGRLLDNSGNYVDFKNTIIILTSNIGSRIILEDKDIKVKIQKVLNETKNYFKPEFLNRLDDIIVFNKLNKKDITLIIKKELKIIQDRLSDKEIKINFCKSTYDYLLNFGYSDDYGVRPLKRIIEKEIGNVLADAIIQGDLAEKSKIELSAKNDKIKLCF